MTTTNATGIIGYSEGAEVPTEVGVIGTKGDHEGNVALTREMSVEVELGPITAGGYRVLLGHPFARHAARGGDLVTVASLKARDTAERALAFAWSFEGKPYRYDGGLGPCGEPGPDGVACDLQRNHDCQHAAYGREPDADGNVGLRRTWGRMTDVERALAEADPYRPVVDGRSVRRPLVGHDPRPASAHSAPAHSRLVVRVGCGT